MANSNLIKNLQLAGPKAETGCLYVERLDVPDIGEIYLTKGLVTRAFTRSLSHRVAVLGMLAWEKSKVEWRLGEVSDRVSCQVTTREVLFEFGKLAEKFPANALLLSHIQQMTGDDLSDGVDKKKQTVLLPDFRRYTLYLEAENTELKGYIFELKKGTVIIGATPEFAELVIPHHSISRRHCSVSVTKNTIQVLDLGSTNGIYFREEKVEDALLVPGDAIYVGSVLLRANATIKNKSLSALTSAAPVPQNIDKSTRGTAPFQEVPKIVKPLPAPKRSSALSSNTTDDDKTKTIGVDDTLVKRESQRRSIRGVNAFNWRLTRKK
ncbi:MAG: FHA domain-containing protein [Verrucomicrobiota bacterium]